MTKLKYAYVFRRDFQNPGDLYSCPMHYLTNDKNGIMIDVYDENVPELEVDIIFIGGGAIFSTKRFIHSINNILSKVKAKHKIVWGAGLNDSLKEEITTSFDLFGIRDFVDSNQLWTPCPSVLHPTLIKNVNKIPTHKFLVIDHWKRPINFPRKHTRMFNKPNNIDTVIDAIADHKRIFTTSYHVAYWATLLKKKTYVIGEDLPLKFYTMKHSPVIASKYSDALLMQGTVYRNAYDECIDATKQFRNKLEELVDEKFKFSNPTFN
jgi:hypothetical protein